MKIKKPFLIYIIAVFVLFLPLKTFAEGEKDALWRKNSYERKVNTVGHRILRANEIQELITFRVPPKTTGKSQVNASAEEGYAVIIIERPLLKLIDNDDELAGVLSHEITHIINRHGSKHNAKTIVLRIIILPPLIAGDLVMACFGSPYPFLTNLGTTLTGLSSNKANQKYELDADRTAVDLMVKARYNPIYMETICQKILSDGSRINFFRSHPKGSIRVANIHQKIVTEYPEFLEQKIDEEKKLQEKVKNDENQEDTYSVNDKTSNPKHRKGKKE